MVRGRAAEALGQIGDARAARADRAALVVASCRRRPTVMTVRGDDPGSATDPWLRAAARRSSRSRGSRTRAAARAGAPRRRRGRASTGGPPPGWRCGSRARRCRPVLVGGRALQRSAARARSPRAGWARSRTRASLELLAPLAQRPRRERGGAARCARSARSRRRARGAAAAAAPARRRRAPSCSARRCARSPPCRPTAACASGVRGAGRRRRSRGSAPRRCGRWRACDREDFALVLSGLDPDPRLLRARRPGRRARPARGDEIERRHPARHAARTRTRACCRRCSRRCARRAARTRVDTLRRHLEHAGLRGARGRRRGPRGAQGPPALGRAARGLHSGARSRDARPRRAPGAVVAALAAQKDDAARAALARGGAQRSRRARCARGRPRPCATLGGEAPAPGPEPVARAPLDYRAGDGALRARGRTSRSTRRAPSCTRATARSRSTSNVVEAPLTSASFMDARAARLLRRAHLPPRGAGLRGPGRRPARRRQRRPRLHAALRDRPAALRARRGGHGALGQGHGRQPVLHHARAAAAPRRRLHALRPGGGGHGGGGQDPARAT